ncbi:MAG TPA: adenylate/guanylate cyclase domain-containing protein [Fimbriimonas sp.]
MSDESVEQMIALAERLRSSNGGSLDDSAIAAISEATGAPTEYVRLAVKIRTEQRKDSALANLRAQYLTLEPDMRRYIQSGVLASACALLSVAESWAQAQKSNYGVFGMFALVFLTLGIYNISLARGPRSAMVAGAVFGGGYFAMNAVFAALFHLSAQIESFMLIPFTILGAVAGIALQSFVTKYRPRLGLKDPVKERQELLRQMVDLQAKLKASEEHCTFVSLDIVGSTRMKELADPLAVEFTFNEYHHFVERVTAKHGGKIHSTAGDGIICSFEHPQQAFTATRNIQSGLIELNTFRNKIGVPIQLRAGIHTGTVMTAQAGDITSVNFAHVIDIAAHLQKAAPPGGIVISDAAAIYLPGGADSVGRERVCCSNVEGSVWSPRLLPPVPTPVPEQAS